PLDGAPRGDLEPAVGWTRVPAPEDFDGTCRLVSIDQRAAYLASAGMLEFGYGQPTHLTGGAAAAAAVGEKGAPFGLWRCWRSRRPRARSPSHRCAGRGSRAAWRKS
ncbi:hypothetical protein P3H15_54860, partial [Rhodococcus sp. T2V]|nr:hypothetical protein [Rhodococcus sp. T2V]